LNATESSTSPAVTRLSCIIGWTYFAAWSISFYPQLYDNYRRKSVVGLSFDFVVYSFIGFFCYSVYTVGMISSPSVREAYRQLHGMDNDVAANDLLFALHSLLMTIVAMYQCTVYHRGDQTVSALCQNVTWVWAVGMAASAAVIVHLQSKGVGDAPVMWLYYMYAMSLLKLISTIVKYIPQVRHPSGPHHIT
jgi:cystinosin